VLPIGGIKEKVLAAHRTELKTVIMPRRNEVDLEDVPDEIKEAIEFVFVDTVDDVLQAALEVEPASKKKTKKKAASKPRKKKVAVKSKAKPRSKAKKKKATSKKKSEPQAPVGAPS
jgi:ATP-dependent Lon protease